MKKITDKDVEALKAGKKVTKGFIHMQLDDKGILNMWTDNNITDKYRDFEIDVNKLFDGKWTFVKRGENFGIKLVKVLPKIHKISLDMIAKDIFRPENK